MEQKNVTISKVDGGFIIDTIDNTQVRTSLNQAIKVVKQAFDDTEVAEEVSGTKTFLVEG